MKPLAATDVVAPWPTGKDLERLAGEDVQVRWRSHARRALHYGVIGPMYERATTRLS